MFVITLDHITTDEPRYMIGLIVEKDVPVVSKFKAIVMHRNE